MPTWLLVFILALYPLSLIFNKQFKEWRTKTRKYIFGEKKLIGFNRMIRDLCFLALLVVVGGALMLDVITNNRKSVGWRTDWWHLTILSLTGVVLILLVINLFSKTRKKEARFVWYKKVIFVLTALISFLIGMLYYLGII